MALCKGLLRNLKAHRFKRFYSSKPIVKLNEDVRNNIEKEVIKPRHHPGRIKVKTINLPETIVKAIENASEDYSITQLVQDGQLLARHLHYRLPAIEKDELQKLKKAVIAEVLQKVERTEPKTDLDEERFEQSIKDKTENKLRSVVYNWTPINFDRYNSFLYLYARFAPDYAVLVKIFHEIAFRDETFKPKTFFDFGSGTGTATWAANLYWKSNLYEYLNVDTSRDMNDLALLLLQGGRGNAVANIKGTFYRQFLPANNMTYDLVVCAYSLMELPSLRSRLQTVLNLWNKTAGYLVIVEHGTNAGFKVINQVRDFILHMAKKENTGYAFSPCPHDMICPRYLIDTTPCSFEVSYMTLPLGASSVLKKESYSYVVLKKGKRDDNDPQWPRIVRSPLLRSRHVICRMCTKNGKLEEVIFTASKHTKPTYRCAKSSERGDLLPVEITT